jgi:1,4-dihydroxy-2-naphthoate octaprenyltransferase
MTVAAWILAARPKTLTAAAAPVLVGSAVAARSARLEFGPLAAVLLGALLLQIASNFANDVFDFEKGADTEARLGPVRAVQAGLLSPRAMKRGLLVALGLALAVGIYLTTVAGPLIVLIGIASMLCAVAYTGGPYPLGYHGLGDLFVFLFFGPVAVCGTTFVHLGHVPELALLYSVPMGLLATNILIVNNLRDYATDRQAGKRTLVVRFGPRFGRLHYLTDLLLAYLLVSWPALAGHAGGASLLPLLSAIPALAVARSVLRAEGSAYNLGLGRTAQILFLFGAMVSLGLWLDGHGS